MNLTPLLVALLVLSSIQVKANEEIDGFEIDDSLRGLINEEKEAQGEGILSFDSEPRSEGQSAKPKEHFEKTCPLGYFQCNNGECLSPKWRCDGHYDCDDFSDELNCTTHADLPVSVSPTEPKIIIPEKIFEFEHERTPEQHKPVSTSEPVTAAPLVPSTSPPPPPPKNMEVIANDLTFNTTVEPLMLFSTGLSIRGYWMQSRIYFDVFSMIRKPIKTESPPSITQALSVFFDLLNIERPSSQPASGARAISGDAGVVSADGSTKLGSTIVGVDMDPSNKEVYWVELGKDPGVYSTLIDDEKFETRFRRQFKGPKRKTLVDSGLLSPEDIALDSVGKNLYITDAGLPAIVVCSIKYSHCKILLTEGLNKPRAIIADSSTGWITYTDWGDRPGIFLVTMDGKRRETLINTGVVWPNGLAADHETNQLYWADARLSKIERIDLKTRKRYEVVQEIAANPFSLSLFEDRIFWSDWSGNDIRTCNKYSGNQTQAIMRTENIYGIHIYHPSIDTHISGELANPCWSKHCSHMCLLAPTPTSFKDRKSGAIQGSCACPEFMTLSGSDKSTCYEQELSFLLVNVKNYIAQVFPEQIGLDVVEKVVYSKQHIIQDIASDWLHYRLFFFDSAKHQINLVDLSQSRAKIENILPTGNSVRGLTYDAWSDNLYWLDYEKGTLSMGSVRGKFETMLRKDLDQPVSMVLDPKYRVFYIALLGIHTFIMRTNIFGHKESDMLIASADMGRPIALHLDEKMQRLYWADSLMESIESIDLDLKSSSKGTRQNTRMIHKRRLGTVLSFAVHHDSLVWTIQNSNYLYRSKLNDPSDRRPVSFKLPPSASPLVDPSNDKVRIIVADPITEVNTSPCFRRGCSHGCVLDASHNAVCICPDNYKIQSSNRTNCISSSAEVECGPNMFKCPGNDHCYMNSWKCDGISDCENGFDEKDCHEIHNSTRVYPHREGMQNCSDITLCLFPEHHPQNLMSSTSSPIHITNETTESLVADHDNHSTSSPILLLVCLTVVFILGSVIGLIVYYKPRQLSQLSIRFSNDDGAMLLED